MYVTGFYAWGAYTAAFFIGKFSDMGMPDALGFLIILAAAIVVGVVLGFVIEQGILKYMYHRDEVLIVLATFGLFLVLEDIILLAFGTDPYFAYQPMALLDAVEMGGIVRDVYGLTLIGVAALVAVGCWYLLNRTKWGTLLKAVIFDREMGIAMGINVPLVYTMTFIGGAILGGLGGIHRSHHLCCPRPWNGSYCTFFCSCCRWWHGLNSWGSNWFGYNWYSQSLRCS